jgi:hypothetical protein
MKTAEPTGPKLVRSSKGAAPETAAYADEDEEEIVVCVVHRSVFGLKQHKLAGLVRVESTKRNGCDHGT